MILKKLGTIVATGTLLATVMTPAAFAKTTIVVSGNGSHSDNDVHVTKENNTVVLQGNVTVVETYVSQTANTGGNNASGNTGGDVTIETGKATNTASVTVQGGDNKVTLPEPCGCDDDTKVEVKNNGAKSDTDVKVKGGDTTFVGQFGGTFVGTGVSQISDTGNNQAKNNTGKKGKVKVTTKNAKDTVEVSVTSGDNIVH